MKHHPYVSSSIHGNIQVRVTYWCEVQYEPEQAGGGGRLLLDELDCGFVLAVEAQEYRVMIRVVLGPLLQNLETPHKRFA